MDSIVITIEIDDDQPEQYAKYRHYTNFPAVILGITANRLEIVAAVCVGEVYASRLLCLDVSCGFHTSANIIRIARVFQILKRTGNSLDEYYHKLSRDIEQKKAPDFSFLFPDPTLLDDADPTKTLPKLQFKRFFSRTGNEEKKIIGLRDRTTALYVASFLDDSQVSKEVIVKLTPRYNGDAHRILANAGLAPKLYFCDKVVGDLHFVVMDRLVGTSVFQLVETKTPLSVVVLEKVRQAVDLLHAQNIVFGDLRSQNIFVLDTGDVYLVDFDWAGTDGVSRYPATLNVESNWSDGVLRHGIMSKAHDLWQLKQLEALYKEA